MENQDKNPEEQIRLLFDKKNLIPDELMVNLFENRKEKIRSLIFDHILKNDLKIYFYENNNLKDYFMEEFDKYKYDLLKPQSLLKRYTKYSKKYEKEIISMLNKFTYGHLDIIFLNNFFRFLINDNVLGNLFNPQYNVQCLTFIRQVSDLIYFDWSYFNNVVFNIIHNYFQNIFRYSRRLMTYIFVDYISRVKYGKNMDYSKISIDDENDDYFLKIIYEKENEKKEILVKNKAIGINSGIIIEIEQYKYYIKVYHGGSKKKSSYDSLKLFLRDSSNPFTFDKNQIYNLEINLIEPLIYFILEELKYGPEVEIIINPYVIQGLYIATKDIEEKGKIFYLFKDIKEKLKNMDLININQNLVISLNELDIISKLFGITDLNIGNFGFLEEERNKNIYKDIKIIDFIPPSTNNFHSSYKYLIFKKNYNDDCGLSDKNILEKISGAYDNIKKKEILITAFQKFKNRLKEINLKTILEKSLKKLINIFEIEKGNNDEIMNKKRKNYELIGFQDFDENLPNFYQKIKSEIENYIRKVENNYYEFEANIGN